MRRIERDEKNGDELIGHHRRDLSLEMTKAIENKNVDETLDRDEDCH